MKDGQKTVWFAFKLEQHDNTLISTWNPSTIITKTDAPSFKSLSIALLVNIADLEQYIEEELDTESKQPVCLHIRIMTDDAVLAILPWQQMAIPIEREVSSVIEVSPPMSDDQSGYSPFTLSTPLLAIPASPQFSIAGDRHYRLIQEYLHSYLAIYGTIPRAYSAAQLRREIKFQQPDLLYIYAKYEHDTLCLDSDPTGNDAHVSLATLGEWLEEAEIRPVVILSLVKGSVSSYPATLVNNSRLLWIQQTRREARQDDLYKNMADVLQALAKTPELSQVIMRSSQQQKYPALKHQLWLNGRSLRIQLSNDASSPSGQLRAALLRVMLGRRFLKESMFSEITHSKRINNRTLLSYVVSGHKMACPFDFPTQLQQRLQWDDHENALPVIPFYLHIDIEADQDAEQYAFDCIDHAVGQGLRHGSPDVLPLFEKALEQRGLLNQPCCISLNWLVRVFIDDQQQLEAWLKAWTEILCEDFSTAIPDTTVVVNALCLQIINNDDDAQKIQRLVNRYLKKIDHCALHLIRINDALGRLQPEEIEDFFDDNADWRATLQFNEYQIDSDDYVEWLMQQTAGAFDATVRLVWQQYQQGYQAYLAS